MGPDSSTEDPLPAEHTSGRTNLEYPEVSELATQWNEVAERLVDALEGLSDRDVLAPNEGFPVPDQTVSGALMFRAWHESYHVGQLGLNFTELGYLALRERLLAQGKK